MGNKKYEFHISIKAFFVLFFFVRAFALNMDSIPIWNPDYLVYNKINLEQNNNNLEKSNTSLETHGYKSMSVTVGDGGTQVDQELRLSIQGFIGDSVYIDALLSDVDRKAGDQTTATLQEVDQIYFKAMSKHWMIHLGDLTWKEKNMGLFGLERSSLGAMIGLRGGYSEIRGVIATDETSKIVKLIKGISGQRSGYSISEDGSYLSVVPGSERVWLNGILLSKDKDYDINYAGGLLNFKGKYAPTSDDEIRIEYNAYEEGNFYNMYGAHGAYRHPNLFLDVLGFRLENDTQKLKHNLWTEDDYKLLKNDRGVDFERDDSTTLNRPTRTDLAGARLRFQGDHRFYADLEIAHSKQDTNTLSKDIEGPEGFGYRWFITTDSSYSMKKFPVAFSIYGNFIQEEYGIRNFKGSDDDWNEYQLLDKWDLDSSLFQKGELRHDEFSMRIRLLPTWFINGNWGYRQGENEVWNSSRGDFSLVHKSSYVQSNLGVAHVSSFQQKERERFEFFGNGDFLHGMWRPFGNFDLRYTESDSLDFKDYITYEKSGAGFSLVGDQWNISEALESKLAKRKEDLNDNWNDTLKSIKWIQTAEWQKRYFSINHFLQFERRNENNLGDKNSWVGDFSGRFGDDNLGIVSQVDYSFGLTEEQTYTPIYKAVAKGTGDVYYDSLTGTFIEGVDNGDFVYEGMGRNDSLGAVLASNASFKFDIEWSPGIFLGVHQGITRDIHLGAYFDAIGEDTTGEKIYFPPATPHQLNKISSGSISYELKMAWEHPRGISLIYKPGADYDKKLSFYSYFERKYHHFVEGGFQINDNHFVGSNYLYENEKLKALQVLNWDINEASLWYRFDFFNGFFLVPLGKYRYGEGDDDLDYIFDAYLWEGALKLGYSKKNKIDGFVQFSLIQLETGDDIIPYQMMSGYSEGRTYRLESSISVELNDFISFALHYLLRFGNSEENIFQKFTTEAKAYF